MLKVCAARLALHSVLRYRRQQTIRRRRFPFTLEGRSWMTSLAFNEEGGRVMGSGGDAPPTSRNNQTITPAIPSVIPLWRIHSTREPTRHSVISFHPSESKQSHLKSRNSVYFFLYQDPRTGRLFWQANVLLTLSEMGWLTGRLTDFELTDCWLRLPPHESGEPTEMLYKLAECTGTFTAFLHKSSCFLCQCQA